MHHPLPGREQRRQWSQSPLTARFVERLIETLGKGFSVCTCLHNLQREGWTLLPSQRTVHYALENNLIRLPDGHFRYCPRNRKRRRSPPVKGRILPNRRSIEERPEAIATRKTLGHCEMDCVCSCRSGNGGVLVLIERQTGRYIIRKINHISQKAIARSLRRLMRENALHTILSVTTDNGATSSSTKPSSKRSSTPPSITPTPTPHTRKAASKTPTASSATGAPNPPPTSPATPPQRSNNSKTTSTPSHAPSH